MDYKKLSTKNNLIVNIVCGLLIIIFFFCDIVLAILGIIILLVKNELAYYCSMSIYTLVAFITMTLLIKLSTKQFSLSGIINSICEIIILVYAIIYYNAKEQCINTEINSIYSFILAFIILQAFYYLLVLVTIIINIILICVHGEKINFIDETNINLLNFGKKTDYEIII